MGSVATSMLYDPQLDPWAIVFESRVISMSVSVSSGLSSFLLIPRNMPVGGIATTRHK